MSFSTRVYVGSVVAAIAVGAFTGAVAFSRPGETVYKDREVIRYRDRETTNTKVATVAAPVVRTVYLDRTITVPGGTVTVEKWRDVEHKGPVTTTAEEQTVIIREVDVVREIIKIVTQQSRWTLGAVAGIDTSLRTQAGLTGAMRIVGPLHAQIVVTSPVDGIRPVILGGLAVAW